MLLCHTVVVRVYLGVEIESPINTNDDKRRRLRGKKLDTYTHVLLLRYILLDEASKMSICPFDSSGLISKWKPTRLMDSEDKKYGFSL